MSKIVIDILIYHCYRRIDLNYLIHDMTSCLITSCGWCFRKIILPFFLFLLLMALLEPSTLNAINSSMKTFVWRNFK
jgi:hypothetical protein